MAAHRLELAEARRIAVRAQLLDAPRPTDLLEVVERLTLLQLDPTAAVAPSADLVAWSRLGSDYRPADLQQALEIDRTLFEFNGVVRPMRDLGLYLADMAAWPRWPKVAGWLEANDRFRRDILDQLGESGPLLSREIPDTSTVPWPSSGWTNDRNVTQMLEFLMLRGEVAISGRVGRQRRWDLAERVYPPGRRSSPSEEAKRIKAERRIRALGIARATGTAVPVDANIVGDAGEPATIEGVRGTWRVDPEQLGRPFDGSRGAAVAVRPPDLRPQARRRHSSASSTCSRCTSPRPSAAGATTRCRSSTATGSSGKLDASADHASADAARARDPPGRPVHADDDRGCRRRDRVAGDLARARGHRPAGGRLDPRVAGIASARHESGASPVTGPRRGIEHPPRVYEFERSLCTRTIRSAPCDSPLLAASIGHVETDWSHTMRVRRPFLAASILAIATLTAATGTSARTPVDPTSLTPPLKAFRVCYQEGPFVHCDTSGVDEFVNEPTDEVPCGLLTRPRRRSAARLGGTRTASSCDGPCRSTSTAPGA